MLFRSPKTFDQVLRTTDHKQLQLTHSFFSDHPTFSPKYSPNLFHLSSNFRKRRESLDFRSHHSPACTAISLSKCKSHYPGLPCLADGPSTGSLLNRASEMISITPQERDSALSRGHPSIALSPYRIRSLSSQLSLHKLRDCSVLSIP